MTERTFRPGALSYVRDGERIAANPGDALFSTVTMGATHVMQDTGEWLPIFEDDGQPVKCTGCTSVLTPEEVAYYGTTCNSCEAAFMGDMDADPAVVQKALEAAEAPGGALPPAVVTKAAWRPEVEALMAYLDARDRKMDDGDALQGYADAKAVFAAALGWEDPDRLSRVRTAFSERRKKARSICDMRGLAAAESALSLIRVTK